KALVKVASYEYSWGRRDTENLRDAGPREVRLSVAEGPDSPFFFMLRLQTDPNEGTPLGKRNAILADRATTRSWSHRLQAIRSPRRPLACCTGAPRTWTMQQLRPAFLASARARAATRRSAVTSALAPASATAKPTLTVSAMTWPS